MNWTERRERFRAILSGNRCVHPGSVYDAISARIAEDLGFEVGMFSGSIGSMSVLGAPDLVVLTLTEFAGQAYRICRAGNLALLVDADHGYGNALNVRRTVEELETAGICAMSIEDTVLPRPYGSGGKPSLSSVEEGVGKMKAALSARQDKNLVIAGRTSALAIANLDEAVKRAKAYEAAGVDAVFLAGGVTVEAVEVVSSAIKIPLILGGGGGQLGDLDWLGGASSPGRIADARPVLGRGAGCLRHAEGAARRCRAARPQEHRLARADAAGHPRRRLSAMDERLSRRGLSVTSPQRGAGASGSKRSSGSANSAPLKPIAARNASRTSGGWPV